MEEKTRDRDNTVAGKLTALVPTATKTQSLAQVRATLKRAAKKLETINYIYVLDDAHHLVGVFSIKELFRRADSARVSRVMVTRKLVTIHPEARSERAAYLALRHNLKAIPVVGDDGTFLGIMTSDALLSELYRDIQGKLLQFAGVHKAATIDRIMELSIWRSLRHRLPWLLIGLGGGILASGIVTSYEATIKDNLILAAFLPLIVYMADAISTQTEAFVIRDLALDPRLKFFKYAIKHIVSISLLSVLCGSAVYAFGTIFHSVAIGQVLGISMAAAMGSSVLTGLVIPYLMSRAQVDPANASGPISTVTQDLMSVFIYLSIASWIL